MTYLKAMIAAAWILMVSAVVIPAGGLQSANTPALLVGLAVVPVLVMFALWRTPRTAAALRRHEARR
jgi:hypothetical protein